MVYRNDDNLMNGAYLNSPELKQMAFRANTHTHDRKIANINLSKFK